MKNKAAITLIALILGVQPWAQVEAAPDPAMLKKWQEMNQKLMQMQAQMLEMQKDMSALTVQMLSEGGAAVPAQSRTSATPQSRSTVRSPSRVTAPSEGSAARPEILYGARTDAGMPDTIAHGVTVRDSATRSTAYTGLSKQDLENMGKGLESEAARTTTSPNADEDKLAEDQNIKINAELRYGYLRNRGGNNNRFDSNDSQIRGRLYASKKLNADWGIYGMLEGKKHFLSQFGDEDDWTSGSRLYVEGLTGVTTITAGKFGYLMADGNIYDSDFKGARASVKDGPWTYAAAVGKTNAHGSATLGTAKYKGDNFDTEFGVYKFGDDDWGKAGNSILQAGGHYYWDNFMLGAMWLGSDADNTNTTTDNSGKTGYVLSARYRKFKSWKPGSWSLYANYYNQPWTTYRNHTMNGLANSMTGFKGYGVGIEYAIAQEVVANLEYYKLEDKTVGDTGRTLWGSITYSF